MIPHGDIVNHTNIVVYNNQDNCTLTLSILQHVKNNLMSYFLLFVFGKLTSLIAAKYWDKMW